MLSPTSTGPVQIQDFEATFRLIQTPVGLVIKELRVFGAPTTIQTEPFQLAMDQAGRWEAEIERDAVQYLLEKKAPDEIRNIRADFRQGRIVVTGSVRLLIELGVEAVCNLEIRDGKQVWVVLDSVSVAGVGGKGLVEKHIDKINPLLDVGDLPLQLTLEEIRIEDEAIVARGSIAP